MKLNFEAVPAELRDRKQWLVWRFEPNPKKPDQKPLKVPYWASGKKRCGVQGDDNDRQHLVTLEAALAALARPSSSPYSGVGFAFLPDDGLIGVDIDKCIDPDTGEISEMAMGIINACASYTEYSPSGTGVHIIVAGATRTFKSNKIGLEVFCSSQYFTFTTRHFAGTPTTIEPISETVLNRLRLTVRGSTEHSSSPAPVSPPLPREGVSERARLEAALAYIPASEHDVWIRVGMGLFTALGDGGFRLWDYWSSKDEKYGGSEDCKKRWASFGKQGNLITAATIYKLAIDNNWKPPRSVIGPPVRPVQKSPRPPNGPVQANDGRMVPAPPKGIASADRDPRGEEGIQAGAEAPEWEVASGGDDGASPDVPEWFDSGVDDQGALERHVEAIPVEVSVPSLDVLLAHFALVVPTTNVWDGLRKQLIKRAAFHAWVGKSTATEWEKAPNRRSISRESLPTLIGGRAVGGGSGGGKLDEMLEHLTLLRGTETVWDGIGQQVMTLGAVRADYTAELTGKWQEHALRKTIEAKNLVFDPTQRVDLESHVNIFLGWPLTPKPNADLIKPILALLELLCSAEDNADECVLWILRWLAFPLQHPGAKMHTSLLVFGEKQGTGKSQFFQNVIAPIYGEYGTVASQHQLDSSFTAWRSRKLFCLFEEVLSREDKYSHNGTLKYMITGDKMSINQKNLPERTETNHLNSVFLSNEPQPIPIELEDRRFMVIEARQKQEPAFYQGVQAAIEAGGVEAFYHFLLALPLDDFSEHTKPLMTRAKERVIEFGLAGWMAFHRSWKEGYLSAPYCSCLTQDLYTVHKRWCDKNGEKLLSETKFSGFIGGKEVKRKKEVAVGTKGKTSRMVYVIDVKGDETLEQQIARFRDVADIKGDS